MTASGARRGSWCFFFPFPFDTSDESMTETQPCGPCFLRYLPSCETRLLTTTGADVEQGVPHFHAGQLLDCAVRWRCVCLPRHESLIWCGPNCGRQKRRSSRPSDSYFGLASEARGLLPRWGEKDGDLVSEACGWADKLFALLLLPTCMKEDSSGCQSSSHCSSGCARAFLLTLLGRTMFTFSMRFACTFLGHGKTHLPNVPTHLIPYDAQSSFLRKLQFANTKSLLEPPRI